MGNHVEQSLGFQLAQCFAHWHAADTEEIRQVLLAQSDATRQAAVENGRTQGFFDNRARQVRCNGTVDLDAAERVGFLCHYNAPCLNELFFWIQLTLVTALKLVKLSANCLFQV
ncbi:hypothetical protein D3C73_1373160 [compost metagenome]